MDLILLVISIILSIVIVIIKLHFTYNLLFYLIFIILCSVISFRNIKNGTLSNISFLPIFIWGVLIHILNIQGNDFGLTAHRMALYNYNIPTWCTALILAAKGAIWGGILYYIISKLFNKSIFKSDTYILGISAIGFSAFAFCTRTFIGAIELFIIAFIATVGIGFYLY